MRLASGVVKNIQTTAVVPASGFTAQGCAGIYGGKCKEKRIEESD
jgi:hypothetical protein